MHESRISVNPSIYSFVYTGMVVMKIYRHAAANINREIRDHGAFISSTQGYD